MSVDPSKLNNSDFCLLVWYVQDGESDQAMRYGGQATWNSATQSVDVCEYDSGKLMIRLQDEQLNRIQIVEPDLKDMLLDAEYCISLTMRDLPDGADTDSLDKTGIHWE